MSEKVTGLNAGWFVGIDWASEEHAVHVIDADGRHPKAFMIKHTRDGFDLLVARLAKLGPRIDPGGDRTARRPAGRQVVGGRASGGGGLAERDQGMARW